MLDEFARLESVELREAWPHEATDFTPWLAEEENLMLLGETLGMELELEGQEFQVGDFRVDILCQDTQDNSRVIVENQLERTDHWHLGQILTYSAGLNVRTVVWIAKEFREEHRAALDHLNEIAGGSYQYFGVEIKVWKIGDSALAPQFEIVSKPNDWIPTISQSLSQNHWKTKFWERFGEHFEAVQQKWRKPKPRPESWVSFGIGAQEFSLIALLGQQKKRIGIQLVLQNEETSDAYFHLLKEEREDIEAAFGEELEWRVRPGRKSCSVALYKNDTDPTDENAWAEQHAWMADKLTIFDEVFRQRLKDIDPADWEDFEDEDDV